MKKLDDEIVFDAVKSLLAHSKKRESKESLAVVIGGLKLLRVGNDEAQKL